ncbi:MAG: hypothetical protein Alis3KO_00850 [Aliiglaciecola sp.]
MEKLLLHINENKWLYSILITVACGAALYWLSKYFATRKDFDAHKASFDEHVSKFNEHVNDHRALRELVVSTNAKLEALPTSQELGEMRTELAHLTGRLEGMEPLFKQLLNHSNMLLENELRGEKQ